MSVYQPKGKDGKPKTAFYHFDFRLKPAGKSKSERFFGSTGQTTEKAAKRVEARLRELAALGKLGTLMTLAQAAQRYIDEVAPKVSPKVPGTIDPPEIAAKRHARRQQEHCMMELLTYYGEETPIVSITPDDVAKAVSRRASTETVQWRKVNGERLPIPTGRLPSPATVNRQVVEPLRRVMRRARKHWGIPVDLEQFQWGGRDGIKLEEPAERVRELSIEEELRFWQKLPEDYHLISEMYIISGKRQSLWLHLPKERIDRVGGRVYMRKLKKRREEWHWVTLTERELEIVNAAWDEAPDCPYLFTARSQRPSDKGKRIPITKQMLYDNVKRAIIEAGIKDFRLHDFRHTFGSRALRADGNLKRLMHAMDHSDLKSTLRYAHVLQSEATQVRANVQVTKQLPPNVSRLPSKKAG